MSGKIVPKPDFENEAQIVEPNAQTPEQRAKSALSKRDEALVRWVTKRVDEAVNDRNQKFLENWRRYYRIWRGIWDASDRSRDSERSRIISPATQHAIESQVAEIEEAIFGRKQWFDLYDDYQDQIQGLTDDLQVLRNIALERFEKAGIPKAFADCFLLGALYGTMIGKILVEVHKDKASKPVFANVVDPQTGQQVSILRGYEFGEDETLLVKLEPVSPFDFFIDPAARTIEEAEYCGHMVYKPLWSVLDRMKAGVYREAEVNSEMVHREGEEPTEQFEAVPIIEFCGLVPEELLDVELEEGEELEDLFSETDLEEYEPSEDNLVEAIVTIANGRTVLRATRNPFWFGDRPYISAQYDTVPSSFWGRGVAEKGFNAQKALDAELRARIDGLALSVHPMVAFDVTAIPRMNFRVAPGAGLPVNGPPQQALMPFNFGNVNPLTFQSAGDLERMVQTATGSTDPSSPLFVQPTNSTASGTAMALASAIKRSKRTLSNIERTFIKPFLEKAFMRFMQFDPETFPVVDAKFTTYSTLGITARELETQQMIQLLSVVPPDSPMFPVMLKAIYNNSSLSNKEELVKIIDQMFKPDPQQQAIAQAQTKLALEDAESKIDERKARMAKNLAEARESLSKAEAKQDELDVDLFKEIIRKDSGIKEEGTGADVVPPPRTKPPAPDEG